MKKIFLLCASAMLIGCMKRHQATEEALRQYNGIDVSHHQGKIDWKKVAKDSNIQFVYIKATEGSTYIDSEYSTNIKEARCAGLKVGSYHYFRMTSTPLEQFNNIKKYIEKDCQDLIPMIDVEAADGKSKKEVKLALTELVNLMKSHYGKQPLLYGTMKSYNTLLAPDFNSFFLYIGRYGNNAPIIKDGKASIWQYSENGKISGIDNPVDLCMFIGNNNLKDIMLAK